jgi:hypothetical protein
LTYKLYTLLWWIIFFTIFFLTTGCKEGEVNDPTKVPTGKGKLYGTFNERETMCRLRSIEPSTNLEGAYECVYDHPKSDIDDRVTVGMSDMCPNEIYCDER